MEIITETITKYKASDGRIFDSKLSCIKHEERIRLQKIYMLKTSRGGIIGAFSDENKIKEYLVAQNYEEYEFSIDEMFIDEAMLRIRN